ncbi:hypothetical protein C7448_10555 [Tenacibaculum gallaicum]|uniref:Uncharacterized protein n=1 Tax=Tenacibaculum gallaicum TaxID=561505 RepID=A0A3E0HQS1_9FLAO|nr:hypothetical protein [Tenacibaculum gallaicum]REH48777.1 hypothetical protein C7448_10555 [Tenacibaculum gallaicum]
MYKQLFSNTKSIRDLKIEYLPINKAIDGAIIYFSKVINKKDFS